MIRSTLHYTFNRNARQCQWGGPKDRRCRTLYYCSSGSGGFTAALHGGG
jgi:hypothetical protein